MTHRILQTISYNQSIQHDWNSFNMALSCTSQCIRWGNMEAIYLLCSMDLLMPLLLSAFYFTLLCSLLYTNVLIIYLVDFMILSQMMIWIRNVFSNPDPDFYFHLYWFNLLTKICLNSIDILFNCHMAYKMKHSSLDFLLLLSCIQSKFHEQHQYSWIGNCEAVFSIA